MTIKTQILQNNTLPQKTKQTQKYYQREANGIRTGKDIFLSFNLNALESLDIVRKTMHILCGRNKVLTMLKYDHHVNR